MIELRIESRIDHRSYEAKGIEFEPQHKIGPMGNGASLRKSDVVAPTIIDGSRGRMARKSSPIRHSRSMASHGSGDLYHPRLGRFYLPAFRRQGAIRSGDSGGACLPDLIALGKDGDDQERFTSREKIATEAWLEKADDELTRRMAHGAWRLGSPSCRCAGGSGGARPQVVGRTRHAFDYIAGGQGLASVIGYAGPGKSAMLGVAREVWERGGYRVRGAALSGIAAENLEGESGIGSRTIASLEHAWEQGRDPLTRNDILVVDEAGMIGTRQMERVLSHAREAGATLPNRSADKQHRHGGAMSHKHHEYGKAANHPK
jgi:hypothetical protein